MKKIVALIIFILMANIMGGCEAITNTKDKENIPTLLASGTTSDTLTFDDLEITIKDFVFSKYSGNLNGLDKATDGNSYCVAYLDVKNISTSTKFLNSNFNSNYEFTLIYKDNYKYHCSFFNYAEFFHAHDSIAALETLKNVCVSFKVPDEVKINENEPLCIRFSKNSKNENDYIEWVLR